MRTAPWIQAYEISCKNDAGPAIFPAPRHFISLTSWAYPRLMSENMQDRLKIRLTKCQLGLFGYTPEKKIVKPAAEVNDTLKAAIEGAMVDERLPCAAAWDIAAQAGISKMALSAVCEALGIKVKPCQLGAVLGEMHPY